MKKAINNTTVEVTFGEEVADVKALDFKIEGLEVSNAVVKQTDKKTVVLTTAAQKAGTEYTVTVNGDAVGKFTGVSAVIPTKVELVSTSVQGKLGQQVTVQAKVTVAEGQSAAGIPVTLNATSTNGTLNAPQVVEATTDANGVATYTYTRYAAGNDTVVAYSTGDRSKFSTGYVFWGVDTILAVTEVTEGATINNGANKTYKIAYKDAATGLPVANKTFNVSVLENINVTADKLQNVSVNGVKVAQLNNNTLPEAAQITTDSKGEATFTVSGTNAEATPVVFEAQSTTTNNVTTVSKRYVASDLQATAAKVKFAAVQAEYTIDITRDGGEVAATGEGNGREYKVLVKDKNGAVAKNETVNIAFNEDLDRVIATNTKAGFVNPDTDKYYATSGTGNTKSQISVKTDSKGEATFIIASETVNDYGTPIAWIDINTSDAKQGQLDQGEPTKVAPISHFQAAYLDGSAIKSYKSTDLTKVVTKFDGAETAVFAAELVNQSGKKMSGIPVKKATYTIFNTGDNDVTVDGEVISPNRSLTKTYEATLSSTGTVVTPARNLEVKSGGKTTAVRVIATGIAVNTDGRDYAFTAKEATATFTNSEEVPASYTGYVNQYNPADSGSNSNSLWFVGKKPIKYTGTNVKYYGANGNEIFGEAAWETYLASLETKDVTVSYNKDGDNTTFKVISIKEVAPLVAPLTKYASTPTNGAPVAKENVAKSIAVNGGTLTFTASELATDPENDTLTVVQATSSNAAVATAVATGGNVTVTPVTAGSTTITAVVSDGTNLVTVNATVTVNAANYFSIIGNPAVSYNAGTATKAILEAPTVTADGDLAITVAGGTPINVSLLAGANVTDIAAAINDQANTLVSAEVVNNGADVEITLNTPGNTALSLALANGLTGTDLTPTAVVGNAATPAKYSFKVTDVVPAGKDITVKVGNTTYTHKVAATETSAELIATGIVATITAKGGDYTAAVSGTDTVVLTQVVPSAGSGNLTVTNN